MPFVIICDGGGDAGSPGSGLANLLERVGVDFGIEVQGRKSVPMELSQTGIPDHVLPKIDTLEDERGIDGDLSKKHATLLLLLHPCGQDAPTSDPWLARRYTWVLYIRAIPSEAGAAHFLNGVAVNPDLPTDMHWDPENGEFMWENCRKLGEKIGAGVFG